MFCMLLRKHLTGARIGLIEQPFMERTLSLELTVTDEMGDIVSKRLVMELFGRAGNVILIGTDGRILDCLRHVDTEKNPLRPLLPVSYTGHRRRRTSLLLFVGERCAPCHVGSGAARRARGRMAAQKLFRSFAAPVQGALVPRLRDTVTASPDCPRQKRMLSASRWTACVRSWRGEPFSL
jgi:hypothetical protein